MDTATIGHNSAGILIEVEVRCFNTLAGFARGGPRRLALPAGSRLADVLARLGIPADKVFLALCNGSDVTPGLRDGIRTAHLLENGDVVALSGPVPYSWGYGAPVV